MKKLVKLTSHLAGTFIAICHSTDYTPGAQLAAHEAWQARSIDLKGFIPMGKSIALLFACAALVILAGSFIAPGSVAAVKDGCAPAYGVDPCSTASIPQ
ncbi:hypothetical protein [Rhizobium sp. BE258]|jgi:hypothetical protein|uniref:hypothetical protein n=1 Tax=unclassified Rhizobium TaxID=2613769 RepID=UPI0011D155CA|nr:hypothetical protein [Rhizobium sp. BE258]MDR7143676.1 hypothetical protein [Rhizobium sp. BE258]